MIGIVAVLAAVTPAMGRAPAARVVPVAAPVGVAAALPLVVNGRVEQGGTVRAPTYRRQWPGTYFETAFRGRAAYFRVGAGDVILRVGIDGRPVTTLVKPRAGFYRVDAAGAGRHTLRVDVVSESQAASTVFGGFYPATGTVAAAIVRRPRQIEFIGDSHTVGYGNVSTSRDCTEAQVWATTDTARGVAGVTAARYGADYQVNAISGRGIVRNYDGGAADTVPVAYPYVLFDKVTRVNDAGWHPQAIVIALGTNDFSTALHKSEKWPDRAALHTDYEAEYVAFVLRLRAQHPQAYFVLWATDLAGGEIAAEVGVVADRLRAAGETRVAFVRVPKLTMTGCHFHPSVADDRVIADTIAAALDAQPTLWRGVR